jgi:hypothetical protein
MRVFDDVMNLFFEKLVVQGDRTFSEYCCLLEVMETTCGLSNVNIPDTNFSEPTDWTSMLITSDLEFWMKDVRLEHDTLVRMGSWNILDIPSDTLILGVRCVFKIYMIENVYDRYKTSKKKNFMTLGGNV